VGQLTNGNPVVFRGVPLGRVATIGVDPSGAFVRVGLEIEGEITLEDDSQAIVAPQSLFGDWQLEIVSRARFPRFDYYEVPPGFREGDVRVLGGYALPDISRLTAAADEISDNLAVLTDRFDRAFNEETADALANGIRNIEQMSDDIGNLIQQQAAAFERVSVQVERAAT
jgi:ABC-type transporter Mla subunit MlaD